MLFALFALRHSHRTNETRKRKKIFSRRKLCRERNHNEKLYANGAATIVHGMPRARNVQRNESIETTCLCREPRRKRGLMPDRVLGNAALGYETNPHVSCFRDGTRRLEKWVTRHYAIFISSSLIDTVFVFFFTIP